MDTRENKIGSVTYRSFPPGIEADDCSICYGPMCVNEESATHDPCNKFWHENCFLAWILRGQYGNCPNCRRSVCAKDDKFWTLTAERVEFSFQRDFGLWTYGDKGYIRSKVSEYPRPLRPLKVSRSLERYLASGYKICLLPQWCDRIVLSRHLHGDFLPSEYGLLSEYDLLPEYDLVRYPEKVSQLKWLEDRIRLANADAVHLNDRMYDSGWRVLSFKQPYARVICLVRVKWERMLDEKLAWQAYKKRNSIPPHDRVLAQPCPMWTLESYDEAYILRIDDLRWLQNVWYEQDERKANMSKEELEAIDAKRQLRKDRRRCYDHIKNMDGDPLSLLRVLESEILEPGLLKDEDIS